MLRILKLLSYVDATLMTLETNSSVSVSESVYTELTEASELLSKLILEGK